MRTTRSFNVWNVISHSASRKKEIDFMNTRSNSIVPQILRFFWKGWRFIFRMMWTKKKTKNKGQQKTGTNNAQFSKNIHQRSRRYYNQKCESYFNGRNGCQICSYIRCQQNVLTWLFYTPLDTTKWFFPGNTVFLLYYEFPLYRIKLRQLMHFTSC